MSYTAHVHGKHGRLELEGDFPLPVVEDLHHTLVDAMAAHDSLRIDVRAGAELNFPLLQLLVAAGRTAEQQGRRFTVEQDNGAGLDELLALAGVSLPGCAPDAGRGL